MGQDRCVPISRSIADALATLSTEGFACQVLMVDGQLVHPSAKAPSEWMEVRLRTPAGMVTLRREGGQVSIVVFGNATTDLIRVRDRIAEAFGPPRPSGG